MKDTSILALYSDNCRLFHLFEHLPYIKSGKFEENFKMGVSGRPWKWNILRIANHTNLHILPLLDYVNRGHHELRFVRRIVRCSCRTASWADYFQIPGAACPGGNFWKNKTTFSKCSQIYFVCDKHGILWEQKNVWPYVQLLKKWGKIRLGFLTF